MLPSATNDRGNRKAITSPRPRTHTRRACCARADFNGLVILFFFFFVCVCSAWFLCSLVVSTNVSLRWSRFSESLRILRGARGGGNAPELCPHSNWLMKVCLRRIGREGEALSQSLFTSGTTKGNAPAKKELLALVSPPPSSKLQQHGLQSFPAETNCDSVHVRCIILLSAGGS